MTATAVSERPRALVVAARFPGFGALMAGHRICAAHVANLAEHYTVDLFVVCRDREDMQELDRFRALCDRVEVVTLSRNEAILNVLTHPHLPVPVAARASGRARSALRRFATHAYDVAHFEWTEAALFASQVTATRKQILCHDILSELFARRMAHGAAQAAFWGWQTRCARRFEATQLAQMDRVFALSGTDAADIAAMGVAPERVCVIAPEFYRSEPTTKPWDGAPRNLLLWGAFSRAENREAATVLLRDILPKLARDNVRLLIAGAESDKHFASSDAVQVLGRVADPATVFAQAHIAVYPLYQGSGLKIKVLEALYAGLPVVTTEVGREGYTCGADDGLFPAETPEAFVATIRQLLTDRRVYDDASASAARWARSFVAGSRFGVA